jgi:integrase
MTKSIDIRTLRALDRPVRFTIPDTKGLHLWVRKDLKKYWVFRYTEGGKRYDMGLGSFPEITIADARRKVARMRGELANGVNPSTSKRQLSEEAKPKSKVTFAQYVPEHIERISPNWSNIKSQQQWLNTLSFYANPVIGKLTFDEITTDHILEILEPIWKTKNETASRLRGRLDRIIGSAITKGMRKEGNPAIWKGHLEHLLPAHRRFIKHHEALPYKEVPDLLVYLSKKNLMSYLALQFTILTASRTGEVIHSQWSEVKDDVWVIPAHRMKAKREHQVPLCNQALKLLKQAKAMGSESAYIFNREGKPLSNMTMIELVRVYRKGLTVHGFRSSFRDWVSEETMHSSEVAEMALAHAITNKVEAAYRRGILLERRRALLQDWENYCLSKTTPTNNSQAPITQ